MYTLEHEEIQNREWDKRDKHCDCIGDFYVDIHFFVKDNSKAILGTKNI